MSTPVSDTGVCKCTSRCQTPECANAEGGDGGLQGGEVDLLARAVVDGLPPDLSFGVEEGDTPLLPGIALGSALAEPGGRGAGASAEALEAQADAVLEAQRVVREPLRVRVERRRDGELVAEVLRHAQQPVADEGQRGGGEVSADLLEASGPLAAEESAVVAEPDDDRGAVGPEGGEGDGGAVEGLEGEVLHRSRGVGAERIRRSGRPGSIAGLKAGRRRRGARVRRRACARRAWRRRRSRPASAPR